ncbi:MAG: diphthamide biosynthesis enzyme Dph2 [Candidatus Aenigmatarchaeota archaeon]
MEEAIKKLKKIKAKKVLVQFPEGLKLRIQEISKKLEKEGFDVVLCLEPCFGACDIRDEEAKRLGCDAILHIGHEEFLKKNSLPVVYWEYFIDANPIPILEKEFEKIKKFEKIGIVTSIQFVKTIKKVKNFLEKKAKKVFTQKILQHPAQILGCDLRAAEAIEKKVDCFLCVSAGKFYGLGLVLKTNKPVFCLDLEKGEIYSLEEFKRKIEKIITWNRAQFKEAKRVGILVSWKKGQLNKNFFELKKKLEKEGKEIYILAMDEITPEKIEGLSLDFLINLACPRIGIDDLEKYKIPVLNVNYIF